MELKFSDIDYICERLDCIIYSRLKPYITSDQISFDIDQAVEEFKYELMDISNRPENKNNLILNPDLFNNCGLCKEPEIEKCPICSGSMFPNYTIENDEKVFYDECCICGYEKYD
jgi:hypothetical protein